LAETVEDVRQKIRIDALAGVAHDDLDLRVTFADLDLNAPPLGGEFDRIREQVPDDLLQTRRVGEDFFNLRAEVCLDLDLLSLGRRLSRFRRRLDRVRDAHRSPLQMELAGYDPRDV